MTGSSAGNFCPLCRSRKLRPYLDDTRDWEYGVDGRFGFLRCPECRLLVLNPMPTLEDLKGYYPDHYHGFHTSRGGIVSQLYRVVYEIRFREYARLCGEQGRLLDIGCADAPYFDLLGERFPRMECVGIEFLDRVAQRGRDHGRRIITGTLSDLPPDELFNLIVMNNLIEHVLDPVSEIELACRHLKPEGSIILETPNHESFDFVLFRRFWGGLHVPRHTFLFSPRSLRSLAHLTGFELESCTHLLNTDHWGLSVQNLLQSMPATQVPLNHGRSGYYPFLLFAFLPLSVLQKILGFGGSLTAVFRKRPQSRERSGERRTA